MLGYTNAQITGIVLEGVMWDREGEMGVIVDTFKCARLSIYRKQKYVQHKLLCFCHVYKIRIGGLYKITITRQCCSKLFGARKEQFISDKNNTISLLNVYS